jgi:hypothetical protein
MLGRTIDKARAKLDNALGEYRYNCRMDGRLFAFAGIDADAFLTAVNSASTDDEVVQWMKMNHTPRSEPEIREFNERFSHLGPEDEESRAYFEEVRQEVAPNRPDVRSWFDLIEADEGRLN